MSEFESELYDIYGRLNRDSLYSMLGSNLISINHSQLYNLAKLINDWHVKCLEEDKKY